MSHPSKEYIVTFVYAKDNVSASVFTEDELLEYMSTRMTHYRWINLMPDITQMDIGQFEVIQIDPQLDSMHISIVRIT